MILATGATWAIAGAATAGVIARPMRWPEWIWAVAGAAALVVLGLVSGGAAGHAVGEGLDVYLFLAGMMVLSETARVHGLFDWVAAVAVDHARQSPARLFALVYAAGVVVTAFMSNDATAVVLTPAVFAAARRARIDPVPPLLACAFVANAASFVLPISNPANLVLYGGNTPPLGQWLASFALPSVVAIVVTFAGLRYLERERLAGSFVGGAERPELGTGGRAALAAIGVTAIVLLTASAIDQPLGLPTAIVGIGGALVVAALTRSSPVTLVRGVSWGVLPLVAGLFVLVEGLNGTGVIGHVAGWLREAGRDPIAGAAWAGTILAFASNLMNNLPAGLIASTAVAQAQPPRAIVDALLIGVDLGPNLSVTGSLATILWLQVIRREGEDIGFWRFLKVGAVVMPLSLAAALGMRLLLG